MQKTRREKVLSAKVAKKAAARTSDAKPRRGEGTRKSLFREIIDNSPDAIIVTDARGLIHLYSRGSALIFGYTPREILGTSLSRLFAKGEEEMRRVLEILRLKHRISAYELDFLRKDGKRVIGILAAATMKRAGFTRLFVMKDLSGGIRLERGIYESKIELESVFDSIVDPLAVVRKDFKISRANRATAKLVKMDIKEVAGRKCHELLNRSSIRCQPCPVKATYESGKSEFAEIESKELGEVFHVYSYPILDYRGDLKEVIEHRRIVTAQKKLETQRHRLELELMERHKLSSVGLLAQGIAHNLNTPLGVIMGRSELLRDDVRKALVRIEELVKATDGKTGTLEVIEKIRGQSEHTLEIILKQVESMSSIIRNLMDIGRQRQDSARKKLNVNHILEQELRFLEADMFFKHDIAHSVELDPDMPYVEGVYSDFSQSFTNIIRNAMDAMHGRSVKELAVRTSHDADSIYVEIHDTGEGIKEEHLPRIFDPFFTTKDMGGAEGKPAGVGLGLHSCYQLLSPYGVKFNVKSKPGDTTFTIVIPHSRNKP
jgi:PAS domain S-box-containing protein